MRQSEPDRVADGSVLLSMHLSLASFTKSTTHAFSVRRSYTDTGSRQFPSKAIHEAGDTLPPGDLNTTVLDEYPERPNVTARIGTGAINIVIATGDWSRSSAIQMSSVVLVRVMIFTSRDYA